MAAGGQNLGHTEGPSELEPDSLGIRVLTSKNLQLEQNRNLTGSVIMDGDAQQQQTPVLSDCENTAGAETELFANVRFLR